MLSFEVVLRALTPKSIRDAVTRLLARVIFEIGIIGRILQFRRVGDEKLSEATSGLHQFRDCLSVDGAWEFLVEVGESVRSLFFFASP
jgi:hypothetical protein